MSTHNVPPGWYPDPNGAPSERYWDGNNWGSESRPLSYLQNKPAPVAHNSNNKVGLDSNEKIILGVIVGIFILVVLASSGM